MLGLIIVIIYILALASLIAFIATNGKEVFMYLTFVFVLSGIALLFIWNFWL